MHPENVILSTFRWLRFSEEDLITAETLLEQTHIAHVNLVGLPNNQLRKH